jgi:hypothetical protein
MDLPEIRIVRQALDEQQLDPVVALAIILRTMMQAHVEGLMKLSEDDLDEYMFEGKLPEPPSMLDALYQLIDRDELANGALWQRHVRALGPGGREEDVQGAGKLAGELMVQQSCMSELLAVFLDIAEKTHNALAAVASAASPNASQDGA